MSDDLTCRCCGVVRELVDILALFHGWGSEAGAMSAMTEAQHDRYRWALVSAADRAAAVHEGGTDE